MSATPGVCFHPTVEMVQEIHAEAVGRFGGSDGVRNLALLESALAAPQASLRGCSPYKDIAEIATAYLFYLCKNNAFIDGNKRTALGACIVFLRLNGIEPRSDGQCEGRRICFISARITRSLTATNGRHWARASFFSA